MSEPMLWTDAEKESLLFMKSEGRSWSEICEALGRSKGSARGALRRCRDGHSAGEVEDSKLERIKREKAELILERNKLLREVEDLRGSQKNALMQIESLMGERVVIPHKYDGDKFKFGMVADPHYGSIYESPGLIDAAYDKYQREGINRVYLVGDLLEGMFPRRQGHILEVKPGMWGCDPQVEYFLERYPRRDGIETFFITGNHDDTFFRLANIDIGKKIAKERKDLIYIGRGEAVLELKTPSGKANMMLSHPDDSISQYSLSYKPQRWIDALTRGHKPNILGVGHYHKYFSFFYRNIFCVLPGSIQPQSKWMRDKRIQVSMGFCMVEATLNEVGIVELEVCFLPDYN